MNLLTDNILGVIDSYGAVHSVNTGDKIEHHGEYFPNITHCRWRWCCREGIHWFTSESKPKNLEEMNSIRTHLARKYSIKFMDNGYHDSDDIQMRFDDSITYTKENKEHIAFRNNITGRGKTKKAAWLDLLETEMFVRIAKKS
jgi:hypothetical protein